MICRMCIAIFIMSIFICGSYSRAATIYANSRFLRRLFEGGYYSKCGLYSRMYDNIYIYINYTYIQGPFQQQYIIIVYIKMQNALSNKINNYK